MGVQGGKNASLIACLNNGNIKQSRVRAEMRLCADIARAGELVAGATSLPGPAASVAFAAVLGVMCWGLKPSVMDNINSALVALVVLTFLVLILGHMSLRPNTAGSPSLISPHKVLNAQYLSITVHCMLLTTPMCRRLSCHPATKAVEYSMLELLNQCFGPAQLLHIQPVLS